jgi:hypothetical protein
VNTPRPTGAELLLYGEAGGFASDWTIDGGDVLVRDRVTPANSLRTTTAWWGNSNASTKWVRRPSGLWVESPTTTPAMDFDPDWDGWALLIEPARTNLALQCRDLTQAAWTKTDCTAAKTADGIDGAANAASTLSATGVSATCLQSITSGSAARAQSFFLRRRTGAGAIEITQDNGSLWTAVVLTEQWKRFSVLATVTNPVVGIRITTSGDEVDVDFAQNEVGATVTSPISTAGSSVTRARDVVTKASTAFETGTDLTIALEAVRFDGTGGLDYYQDTSNKVSVRSSGTFVVSGGSQIAGLGPALASNVKTRLVVALRTDDFLAAANGGAAGADTLGTMWTGAATAYLGILDVNTTSHIRLRHLLVLPRRVNNFEVRQRSARGVPMSLYGIN